MYPMATVMLTLLAALILAPLPGHAADPECMKALADTAGQERQRIAVYVAEAKNLKSHTWAARAASICSGALARADHYYDRHLAAEELCEPGSSYVDNQVTQLFRNAGSVCRDEVDELARSLPPDEQQTFRRNIERGLKSVK